MAFLTRLWNSRAADVVIGVALLAWFLSRAILGVLYYAAYNWAADRGGWMGIPVPMRLCLGAAVWLLALSRIGAYWPLM